MLPDPVSFDQFAQYHNIENVDEWKNLHESKEFDELQTRLNKYNRDLLTEWIQEQQPDFIVQEDENVFDVLRRVDASFEGLSNVELYCLGDSLSAGFNFRLTFENGPVYKVDWLAYLSCLKRYELISVLLERWGYTQFTDAAYSLFIISKFLNDACLDDKDNSLNNLLHSLIRQRHVGEFVVYFMVRNSEFAVSEDGYIHNYIHWLCVIKQTDENSEWLSMCRLSIEEIFERNRADKLKVLLNEITEQKLLSVEELAELITFRENSFSGFSFFESLFERCMMFCKKEICSVILGLLKKEDVPKLLTQGRGRWLLTYLAWFERQDVIETVVQQYGLVLPKDEKDEFHSQLVKGSLSQNMILFLKELASAYIIPEGTDSAKKQALVYYIVKGRESLGEEEAQELITELVSLKFEVTLKRDWEADTLERDMKKDIQRVKDNCSVLVVFMMAHGVDGKICDATNKKAVKYTYVDDIINCTASGTPEGIPKICIIDACRERRPVPGVWEKLKNIVVSEKPVQGPFNVHNYCRILAAAKGEKTWRNVMLPILMEEWKQGGEFYDIIHRVNCRMLVHEDPVCRGILLNKHEEFMPWRPLYM